MFAGVGAALLAVELRALDAAAAAFSGRLPPTLDDFDLSGQRGGLCVSDASHIENIVIIGASACIAGAALLLLAQVFRRRSIRAGRSD
ncbi:hypothetical protein [Leucobacter komagatae]|uniref:Uncharacterized protein n=1 Tax=Leucobacter komagatae TaxID=55969 RepID=A0A0D0HYP7_9MICO|nr:hypothetical protein [Leucobacter komagatae]KIP52721.1 hypothetical protein SD72_07060 [Leucobacter komagatae]